MQSLSLLTLLVLSPLAGAQSFNIDYGPATGPWPTPSSTYGAGANQPGVWNAIDDTTNFQNIPLVDLNGAATGVTVFLDGGLVFGVPVSNGPTGDDANLMNDVQDPGQGTVTWSFSGLAAGDYQVYTYGWAPDDASFSTNVNVPGSADPQQTIGGTWPGMQMQGTTYALHNVTAAAGSIVVEVSTGAGFGSMNGIQIVGGGPSGFASSCNGDGGDQMGCTACPCGNDAAAGTVGGCTNSASTSAVLTGSGSPSVTAADPTDLRFELGGAVPSSFAVLTSGAAIAPQNAANPCFGLGSGVQSAVLDGLRCAVQSTQRHGGRPVDAAGDVGATNNGWGGASGPPAGLAAQGGFVPGQTRHYQVFYRELPGQVCLTEQNTSQAVTVTFAP